MIRFWSVVVRCLSCLAFCTSIAFLFCPSQWMYWVQMPAFRATRSFSNGTAPDSIYVQPWIGLCCGYYRMWIVVRRDLRLPLAWSVYTGTPVVWRRGLSAKVIEAMGLHNERT